MATPGLGHKSYVQFGKETTYGTAVAATKKLEIVSWSVPQQIATIQDSSLYSAQSRRASYQGGSLWKGTFTVRLNYVGLEELLRAVNSTYTSTQFAAAGGVTMIDHKFKEGATLPSYTFEVVAGDIPTGKCFRYTGAKITDLTIKGTAGTGNDAMLMADFSVVAKDCVSNVTPTSSLSYPTVSPVLFHHAAILNDGTSDSSANVRLRNFTMTLAQPHAEDRFYLGNLTIDEPVRSDFINATLAFSQEFITITQYDKARAFTTGSPRLVFRNPVATATSSPGAVANVSGAGQFTITRTGSWDASVQAGMVVNSTVHPAGTLITNVAGSTITVDTAATGAATLEAMTFTLHREIEINIGTATLSDFSAPIEGYGVILSSATWLATYDATNGTAVYLRNRSETSALA